MDREYLIGLDIGTTNIKALVIDTKGRQAACCRRPSPFTGWKGHQVYMENELRENVFSLLADSAAELRRNGGDPRRVRGIAAASMGEMGFPMGAEGALFPAVSWYDPCSEPFCEALRQRLGAEAQYEHLGQRLLYIFSVSRLMWLKQDYPEIYDAMETWLCMADHAAWCLCGSRSMDLSLAARTGMLDWREKRWSDAVIAAAGLDREKLPALCRSGDRLGRLSRAAAEATGLPEGIWVSAGGHDHVCESYACGGGEPGSVMDSSGTTEALVIARDDPDLLSRAGRKGFNIGSHARPGMGYVMGGIPASGASVDWYRRSFGDHPLRDDDRNGVIFLPHLRGSSSPARDLRSRGAFLGLTDRHGPEDMMRAVYEGLAFEVKAVAEEMADGAGTGSLVGVGGGYLNEAWAQMKADVLETEIEVPECREAIAMGAAMLAGVGSGVYADAGEALVACRRPGARYRPREERFAYYREKYGIYRNVCDTLFGIHAALGELSPEGGR